MEEGRVVKILLLGLLPIMLLSALAVQTSIICYAVGVPVLALWMLSALVALKPGQLHGDAGK